MERRARVLNKLTRVTTMRKIKIFTSSDAETVGQEVNSWLASHKSAIIHDILQSESHDTGDWTLTITIFYYEGEQG